MSESRLRLYVAKRKASLEDGIDMIQPPFTAKQELAGLQSRVWIVDSNGHHVADLSPLLSVEERFRVAELLTSGTNSYLRRVELARKVGKSGGRPKKLKKSGKGSIKKAR